MKIYLLDGQAFAEVAENYLLWIGSAEQVRRRGAAETLALVTAALVEARSRGPWSDSAEPWPATEIQPVMVH